ncbi:MAG: 50S ribosomal protein L4 [Cytophagales bacterium]|nr:50S ribosomal protein L4 [Cytophagales bacterium]
MKLAVINSNGEDTGREIEFKDEVFGIDPNSHAVYLDVKQYLANQRQGTAKTKERNEIAGSTRKIKKQKGTGTARAGSLKNPIFRGGGTIFGPQPRDFGFKLNKKVKRLARRSVVAQKIKDNQVKVLEDFSMESPKTKEFAGILDKLSIGGDKALFVVAVENRNVSLSSRNIPNAKVISIDEINTYDLINTDVLVFFESSVETLTNRLN